MALSYGLGATVVRRSASLLNVLVDQLIHERIMIELRNRWRLFFIIVFIQWLLLPY